MSPLSQQIILFLLTVLGGVFLSAALFVWVQLSYSTVAAFAVLGVIYSLGAIIFYVTLKYDVKKDKEVPENVKSDPLAKYIPDGIKSDPRIKEILKTVGENPIAATSAAATLATVVSHQMTEPKRSD